MRPLSIHIGAEFHGVDLTRPLAADVVAEIRVALLHWKVVFFRDQPLDHEQHIQFARQFGVLTPGHAVLGGEQSYPTIYAVSKFRAGNDNVDERSVRPWSDWHTDITPAINPPSASILRAVVVPPYGGDTNWTNLAAVYNSISPRLRSFLDGLQAIHGWESPQMPKMSDAYRARVTSADMMSGNLNETEMVKKNTEGGWVLVDPIEKDPRCTYTNPKSC